MFQNAFKKLLGLNQNNKYQAGTYGGNISSSTTLKKPIASTPKPIQYSSPVQKQTLGKGSTIPSASSYTGTTYTANPNTIPGTTVQGAKQTLGTVKPSTPQGQPQPSQPNQPQQSQGQTISDLLNAQQNNAATSLANRQALLDKQYADNEAYAKQQYDTLASDASSDIATNTQRFNEQKANAMADIQAQRALADKQRGTTETGYGEAQRALAEDRRQRMGQREKQYAALGTIDSYGTGSFQQANTNDETAYNKLTNTNLMQKQAALDQIETNFVQYDQQVRGKVQEMDATLTDLVTKFNRAMRDGQTATAQALRESYNQIQTDKADLLDTFDNLKTQIEATKIEYQTALAETEKENKAKLDEYNKTSDSFRLTGQPQTLNDIMFTSKYTPEYAKNYTSILKDQMGATGKADEVNQLSTIVGELLRSDTKPISGLMQVGGMVPGSSAQLTKNKLAQLQSLLSLENRQKLKGSGAISDFEAKTLAAAASALGSNLSDEALRGELMKLQQAFASRGGQDAGYSNDPLGLGF